MSLIDKLLQMDKAKLMEMPTKKVEMPRLSEMLGETFNVKCKAIDGERYADIQRSAIDLNKMLSGELNAPASCRLNALGFCSFR